MGEDIIRCSALPSWNDCARRAATKLFADRIKDAGYELRTLENHIGANVGSGVHAGAGYALARKLNTGTLGPEAEALSIALHEFDRRAETEGCLYDDVTDKRNTAQRQIERMLHVYLHDVASQITPRLIEERFEADLGDGFILSGQGDVLPHEEQALDDLKTGKLRRANGAQYGAYSMLYRTHGYPVYRIGETFVKRVPLRQAQPTPERHPIPVDAAETDAMATIDDIKRSVAAFDARVKDRDSADPAGAFRANPYSMMCSDRFCPAWGTSFCRSHKGAK